MILREGMVRSINACGGEHKVEVEFPHRRTWKSFRMMGFSADDRDLIYGSFTPVPVRWMMKEGISSIEVMREQCS